MGLILVEISILDKAYNEKENKNSYKNKIIKFNNDFIEKIK